MRRQYGWVPDIPDYRDFPFKRVKPRVKIPDKVDLRGKCSSVEDQGTLGSCTANAGVAVYEYLETVQNMPFDDKSRLFLYWNTRSIQGTTGEDSGASIRDTIKALAKWGVCPEKSWPYTISKFKTKPPRPCYTDAAKHKIISYERLNTLNDMLGCLADGFIFEFGFSVYESFESDKVKKTGIVPIPKKKEQLLGGHAVCGVGYDQKKKWLICRNSWGVEFGDKGYFYLPFDYVTDRNLSDDFWVVRKET